MWPIGAGTTAENGINLIYIRDILGHASVVTTEIYAKANPEMKRHAIETAASKTLGPSRCHDAPGTTCSPGSAKPSEQPLCEESWAPPSV